ncbi:uncharacterized protein VICG_00401 [Vittaforma corneae ATCC 50505]|uniref:Uncharacterized protein n=1 Tax=Vittaforma corneae (strain ATCC 50505) TaxID=993615 RepID=L2GPX9_VITCO|nr:uncharacterized protein VICG_00401 [Vittaforma corneae ATCC 50505]ELA42649.1 hypothetical protein VICG_00401 [Vittaforma corneae ATCC 50505]
MKQCQFCNSHKTKVLNDTLFCENCEIYFTLKNGIQLIKSLPIAETKQRTLNLCVSCSRRAMKNSSIKCRTFREYLKRLPYCSSCKSLNVVFLKNLFFKNFLLYKKIKSVFGLSTLFTLIMTWCCFEKYVSALYYYIAITADGMSSFSFIFTSFLLYHLNQYSFIRLMLFLICLYKIISKKSIYFEIPINLLSAHELDNFIDRLNINSSLESDVYRHDKRVNVHYGSQPHLKNK